MAARRSLDEMLRSGTRVSRRDLIRALADAGYAVRATSSATHFMVYVGCDVVTIRLGRGDVRPVYLSLLRNAIARGKEGGDV